MLATLPYVATADILRCILRFTGTGVIMKSEEIVLNIGISERQPFTNHTPQRFEILFCEGNLVL